MGSGGWGHMSIYGAGGGLCLSKYARTYMYPSLRALYIQYIVRVPARKLDPNEGFSLSFSLCAGVSCGFCGVLCRTE